MYGLANDCKIVGPWNISSCVGINKVWVVGECRLERRANMGGKENSIRATYLL